MTIAGIRRVSAGVGVVCGLALASAVAVAGQQTPRPAGTQKPAAPSAQKPAAKPTPRPAAGGVVTAGQGFKNVQALKDVPMDDFLPLMGLMTHSVGGDCATCHLNAGTELVVWEADTPMKKKAREMSFMVLAINKQHFGGRTVVTCWTCHRGRSTPVQTPTMDQIYGALDFLQDDLVMATAPGLPRPETLVDRYLAALGGVDKVNAITSIAATGTSVGFRGFGGGGAVQLYGKFPDQRSMVIHYEAQGRDATVRSFDGKVGWTKTPLNVLGEHQLHGTELDGAKFDAQMMFPQQIKQALTRMRTLDPTEIDGREVNVIQGNGPRNTFATLYFDKETGLLTRLVRFGPSLIGRMPTQFDYSDYREVGGVKMAHKIDFVWLDGREALVLKEIKANVPVNAAVFGRPIDVEKLTK
ncbi:MAG: photosynthetic reaction center cytochrome c subunit family protein [Vicinamibacterales bacterium]